jgi:drug/metabolite transporter (DMT)-like permease
MIVGTHRRGLVLAASTAAISGVAVFVNSFGVRAWREVGDPSSYTTAKNLVAALFLVSGGAWLARHRSSDRPTLPRGAWQWAGLAAIAVVGGSVPFVLFFEGLARADTTQAAFIHKTLVIWVAVLAVVVLRERIGPLHVFAIASLVAGEAVLAGGVAGIRPGAGEAMILAATLLWAIEVVLAKRLLRDLPAATVSIARMVGGTALLIVFVALRGTGVDITAVGWSHLGWILVAGALLAAYVGTWHLALARAPAIDVTAVLVGGAMITALLQTGISGAPVASPLGLTLLAAGVGMVFATRRVART